MISEKYIAVENPSREERMPVRHISIIIQDIDPVPEITEYLSVFSVLTFLTWKEFLCRNFEKIFALLLYIFLCFNGLNSNCTIYFFSKCQTLINVSVPAYKNKQMVAAETEARTDFIKIATRQPEIRSLCGQPFLYTDRSLPLKHLFFAWCRGRTAWVSKAVFAVCFGSRLIIFNNRWNYLDYRE